MKNILLILFLAIFVLLFSSCMHLMMHDEMQGTTSSEPVLEKEVLLGHLNVQAKFPPLEIDKQTEFTLRIHDLNTAQSIANAHVEAVIEHSSMTEKHPVNDRHEHENHHDNFSVVVRDSNLRFQSGHYSLLYTPTETGNYLIRFHITAIGDSIISPTLTVQGKRKTLAPSKSHGMHGMGGLSTTAIAGLVFMGAMMITMILIGGKMF